MNWDAIGAIGEVTGAAAVVLTLVFLIFQIRQNTNALRQQAARESTAAMQNATVAMMYPEVAGAISKVFSPTKPELTVTESAQIENYVLSFLLVYQQDFIDWQQGLYLSDVWDSRIPGIRGLFASEWIRQWWRTIGHEYLTPEFGKMIDQLLNENAIDGGDYWQRLTDPS